MRASDLVKAHFPAQQAKAIVGTFDGSVVQAGSGQSTAYAVKAANTHVASGTGGVILPVANAGDSFTVMNAAAANCIVYPPTGGKMNDGSANAGITLADNESLMAVCINTTDFMCIIGSAS